MNKSVLRSYVIDGVALTALFVIFHFKVLFTPSLIRAGIDTTVFFQPTTLFAGQNLVNGVIPFWNPHWFNGFPHLAAPRVGVLYPFTFVYGLIDFHRALKIDILLHLWIIGISSYVLGRELFNRRVAALCLAIPMMSGGFVWIVFKMGHVWTLHTLAFAPLMFLFLIKFLDSGSGLWAIAFTLGLALQFFAGDLQTITYELVCLAGYVVLCLASRRYSGLDSWRQLFSKSSIAFACVALAGLLAAPQLLPTNELVGESIRSGPVSPEFTQDFSFDLAYYWNEVLMRNTDHFVFIPFVAGPLALALAAVGVLGKGPKRRFYYLLLIGFAGLYTIMPDFFAESVVQHIPLLSRARAAYRMEYFLIFGFYVLVCYGIRRLLDGAEANGKQRYYWGLFASFVAVIGAVQLAASFSFRAVPTITIFSALLLAYFVFHAGDRKKSIAACLMMVFIFECLDYVHRDLRPVDMSLSVGDYTMDPNYLTFSEQRLDDDRIAVFTPVKLNLHQWWFHSGMGMTTGDRFFWGFHGLYLSHITAFLESCADRELVARSSDNEFIGENFRGVYDDWLTESSARVLQFLNVRYLISKVNPLEYAESHLQPVGPYKKTILGDLFIYENVLVYPPAFTVHDVQVIENDEEALTVMKAPDFDYRNTIVLSEPFSVGRLGPLAAEEPVTVDRIGTNEVVLEVNMSTPGFLVLTDVHYPGWKAEVDDKEGAQVYRVDTFLRGIFLDEGPHRVRFYFLPDSFLIGLVFSACAFVVLLVSGVVLVFRFRSASAISS